MTRRTVLITERKFTIPGYTVQELIGKGAMATVYLAQQHAPERQVALKVMSDHATEDPTFCDRFVREGEIVKQLHHPNIVPIYETGVHQDCYYMSMEPISEGTLKDRMVRILSPRQALTVFMQIAKALGYAHRKGFVHRDVKPANILFRTPTEAVLSDFGVAKALRNEATQLTAIGWTVGTPGYMSPEQALGQPVDGRSDLYSLGVVLYEMLTGERPYQGADSFSTAMLHISTPIPRLPPRLIAYQGLLDRLLAKSPKERFATADEALAACELMLHPHPVADDATATVVRRSALTQTVFQPPAGEKREPLAINALMPYAQPVPRQVLGRFWRIGGLSVVIGVLGMITLLTAIRAFQPALSTQGFPPLVASQAPLPSREALITTSPAVTLPVEMPPVATRPVAPRVAPTFAPDTAVEAASPQTALPQTFREKPTAEEPQEDKPFDKPFAANPWSPDAMATDTASEGPKSSAGEIPLSATPSLPVTALPAPAEQPTAPPPQSVTQTPSPLVMTSPSPPNTVASPPRVVQPPPPTVQPPPPPTVPASDLHAQSSADPTPDRLQPHAQSHTPNTCQKATVRAQQRYARGDWSRQAVNDHIRQHCP